MIRPLHPLAVTVCLLLSLLLPSLEAQAQRSPKTVVPELDAEGQKGDMARAVQKKANERFDKADANKDGFIAKEEAAVSLPHFAENFEKYDKNKDGKLSWEEFVGHDKWKREVAP